MSQPQLSVVLPNYNNAHSIQNALTAIVSQSSTPEEIIVVDDGSTDNSVAIIEEFIRRYPIVRLLKNGRNRGAIFSANHAIEAAGGEYIYWASGNDMVLPGLFQKSLSLLSEHPQAGLCCANWVIFYGIGAAAEYKLGWTDRSAYLSPGELVKALRDSGNYIPGATALIRRSALLEAGFLEELRGHCDWFSLLVIGFRRGICYIPHPLAVWRAQQAGSYSAGNRDWIAQREVILTLIDLLESPTYRDVRLMFQRSGALFFPPHILRVLLAKRRHWNYLSPIVLRRALCTELRRLVVRSMPFGAKRALCSLRSRIVGGDPQLRELLAHFR